MPLRTTWPIPPPGPFRLRFGRGPDRRLWTVRSTTKSGLGLDERSDGRRAPFHHRANPLCHRFIRSRELAAKAEGGGVIIDRPEQHPPVDRHRPIMGSATHHLLRFELDDLHGAFGRLAESGDASLDDGAHPDGFVRRGLEFYRRVPPRVILDLTNRAEIPYSGDGSIDGRRDFKFQEWVPSADQSERYAPCPLDPDKAGYRRRT